jgi:hypothetical protein
MHAFFGCLARRAAGLHGDARPGALVPARQHLRSLVTKKGTGWSPETGFAESLASERLPCYIKKTAVGKIGGTRSGLQPHISLLNTPARRSVRLNEYN